MDAHCAVRVWNYWRRVVYPQDLWLMIAWLSSAFLKRDFLRCQWLNKANALPSFCALWRNAFPWFPVSHLTLFFDFSWFNCNDMADVLVNHWVLLCGLDIIPPVLTWPYLTSKGNAEEKKKKTHCLSYWAVWKLLHCHHHYDIIPLDVL